MSLNINKSPLVSIIMNCYNGEKYLKQSIETILSQTYQNWELIFWDNLSTDNSKIILKNFNDKRIKYFSSSSFLTLYEARNMAIKFATGKYISFLDTDDYWVKDKLYKQINFLEKNKLCKITYSNFMVKNELKGKEYILNKSLPSGKITRELLKSYLIGILTVCMERDIFKTSIFNKRYNIIGDLDFFINLSKNYNIECINEPLAFYRIHSNNYSKKKIRIYINELSTWIKEKELQYNNEGFTLIRLKFFLIKLKIKLFLQYLGV